jgi:hypothetical protein
MLYELIKNKAHTYAKNMAFSISYLYLAAYIGSGLVGPAYFANKSQELEKLVNTPEYTQQADKLRKERDIFLEWMGFNTLLIQSIGIYGVIHENKENKTKNINNT